MQHRLTWKYVVLKNLCIFQLKAHNSHNLNMSNVKNFKFHNGNHEERVIELLREVIVEKFFGRMT